MFNNAVNKRVIVFREIDHEKTVNQHHIDDPSGELQNE